MPFARISLHKGKPADYLRSLSDSLHQALNETFGMPLKDRFQIIHQLEPGELVYDPDYLGGPRSANFVLIALDIGRERDAATKQAFFERLVQRLAEAPGIDPEDVLVQISTSQAEDWSFGGGRQGIGAPATSAS
ncbi:MAG: hypothetical protein GAK43_01101 [Stenotrophomonas maltophilia]|nr:MAG: hypothetical protein GAK43_01101 [Stenotrophomonas maltophilia]